MLHFGRKCIFSEDRCAVVLWHVSCPMKFRWCEDEAAAVQMAVSSGHVALSVATLSLWNWQYINFMSQQATTGCLRQAKQCLIEFWSMATPPEAWFRLLFQQHLERNGRDYIPPVVSWWLYPCGPLGGCRWQSCPAALLEYWQNLSSSCWGFSVTALLRESQVQLELWQK